MPRMVTEVIQRKTLTRAVLEKEQQEAEARLRQALTRQERGVMRTNVTGVVLERAVSNEQFLAGGTVLLKIGQPERLEVETEVLSEDVVRVRKGDLLRCQVVPDDRQGLSELVLPVPDHVDVGRVFRVAVTDAGQTVSLSMRFACTV